MKNIRKATIHISSSGKNLEFQAQVLAYTTVDALKRAGLAYFASLVLVVICVFIPFVHFIAVPGLILFGPVLAFLVFRAFAGQEDLIVKGSSCPHCNQPLKLSTTVGLWPLRDRCETCNEPYLAEINVEKKTK